MSEPFGHIPRRDRRHGAADGAAASEAGPLHAEALFAGRQEVRLLYEGQEYRLRITRNRKLILTK